MRLETWRNLSTLKHYCDFKEVCAFVGLHCNNLVTFLVFSVVHLRHSAEKKLANKLDWMKFAQINCLISSDIQILSALHTTCTVNLRGDVALFLCEHFL